MPEIEGPGGLTYTVRDRTLTRVKQGSIAKACKAPKSIGEFRDNLALVDFQHLPPAWRDMTVATTRGEGGARRPALVFRGDDRDPEKILAAGFSPLIPDLVSPVFRNEKCDILLPTTVCAATSLPVAACFPTVKPTCYTKRDVTWVYVIHLPDGTPYFNTQWLQEGIASGQVMGGGDPVKSQAALLAPAGEICVQRVEPAQIVCAIPIDREWNDQTDWSHLGRYQAWRQPIYNERADERYRRMLQRELDHRGTVWRPLRVSATESATQFDVTHRYW